MPSSNSKDVAPAVSDPVPVPELAVRVGAIVGAGAGAGAGVGVGVRDRSMDISRRKSNTPCTRLMAC